MTLVLSTLPMGVVALFWGKEALLKGVMALLLTLLFFVLLPLAFLARWLRHTAKLFWHCPCCGQPFPYYAPDGRHEEMRNKECYYTLRQMRIGYVKRKFCPLVIPSECPACRRKFFEMAGFTSEVLKKEDRLHGTIPANRPISWLRRIRRP